MMYRRRAAVPFWRWSDSYTYGEEVNNAETWPSILEALTGRKVLNAGDSRAPVAEARSMLRRP